MLDSRLNRRGGLGRLEVLLRGSREIRVLHSGGRGGGRCSACGRSRGLAATEQLLSLGGVVAHVLLGNLGSLGSVGAGKLSKLFGLCSHNVLGVLKVVVDQLLVGRVDQRHSEQEGGGEERKSPVWDDLHEPVGEEGAKGNLGATYVSDVLQQSKVLGSLGVVNIPWQKRRCSRQTGCAETR